MIRATVILAAGMALMPVGLAAQRPESAGIRSRGAPEGAPPAARRQRLQQEIVNRFMDRVALRLGLAPGVRARLEQVIRANEIRRRQLARQARTVRSALVQAARDPNTPDAEYDRLLRTMTSLRARDLRLWESEQAELAGMLTPRQRVQFMAMRLEFFDMVQRMRSGRPTPPPGSTELP